VCEHRRSSGPFPKAMQVLRWAAALALFADSSECLKTHVSNEAGNDPVTLPSGLSDSLILRLEADQGIELDTADNKKGLAPAVKLWTDGGGRKAFANLTKNANQLQRLLNHKTDRTRHTHVTWELPGAKRRAAAGLPDSAPALIKDMKLGVPALFFDGDDYLRMPITGKNDKLVPGKDPMTVIAMINVPKPEKGQGLNTYRWLGLGNPGEFSCSQFNLETTFSKNEGSDEVRAHAVVRVVPVASDPQTPTIREAATIEVEIPMGKPVLLSFTLTGNGLKADINGKEKWKGVGGWSEEEGKDYFAYKGEIDPIADEHEVSFQIGASPASERVYTGEGAYGSLYGALIFKSALSKEKLETAELYLACRFNMDESCDRERARELGVLGKAASVKKSRKSALLSTRMSMNGQVISASLAEPIDLNKKMPLKAQEQGFSGKQVQHVDAKTATADWRKEYGNAKAKSGSANAIFAFATLFVCAMMQLAQ